jgi:mannose-6-phosphate isomerase-like protein (cupin superfamily)
MKIKRVVTAVDADGRSVVAEDAPVKPIESAVMAGLQFYEMWGTSGPVTPPTPPTPAGETFFPGPGETRFGLLTIQPTPRDAPPPEADEETAAAGLEEIERLLPGLVEHMEPDAPGMHTTRTIDYDIVVSGTLTLELDDGVEVELPAGSAIVQNGTRHAWHNYGTEPAVLAYVLIGADPGSG